MTCQILPPGIAGYRPYCPYTRGAGTATYVGPDLNRARALVAASGTKGMRVVVLDTHTTGIPPFLPYVAKTLKRLGYDAHIRVAP